MTWLADVNIDSVCHTEQRPGKSQISFRIDNDVRAWLKAKGHGHLNPPEFRALRLFDFQAFWIGVHRLRMALRA
jgi:hypothetical protein